MAKKALDSVTVSYITRSGTELEIECTPDAEGMVTINDRPHQIGHGKTFRRKDKTRAIIHQDNAEAIDPRGEGFIPDPVQLDEIANNNYVRNVMDGVTRQDQAARLVDWLIIGGLALNLLLAFFLWNSVSDGIDDVLLRLAEMAGGGVSGDEGRRVA